MVNNIMNKVTNLPRLLDKTNAEDSSGEKVVNVISTFGRDDMLCKKLIRSKKFLLPISWCQNLHTQRKQLPRLKINSVTQNVSLDEKHGPSKRCIYI